MKGTGKEEKVACQTSSVFLIHCPSCKRKHRMSLKRCPKCGTYEIPMPVSEKVYEDCHYTGYKCDGCEAYNEHTNPYGG